MYRTFYIICARIPIFTHIFFCGSLSLWELHSHNTHTSGFSIFETAACLFQSPWWYCLRKMSHSTYLVVIVHLTRAWFVSCTSAELATDLAFATLSIHHRSYQSWRVLASWVLILFGSGREVQEPLFLFFNWSCTCQIEFKVKANCLLQRNRAIMAPCNALKHSLWPRQIRILLRIHFSTTNMVAQKPQHSLHAPWT